MLRSFAAALVAGLIAAHAAAADPVEIDKLKSTPPATWVKQEAGGMRFGQFKVPKAEGDTADAELVVFFFGPGGGGGVKANLDRWKGQFPKPSKEPKVEEFKVGDVKVTYLDIEGASVMSSRPVDPAAAKVEKADQRMLAVVFESPNGPYFFRLLGPAKTVAANKAGFDGWVKGFK